MARSAVVGLPRSDHQRFEVDKKDVGARIKKLREEKEIPQSELARYVEKSRSAVAQWEVGNALPDLSDYNRLAFFLNSTPEYIAFGKTNIYPSGISVPIMDYSRSLEGEQIGEMSIEESFFKKGRGTQFRPRAFKLPLDGMYDSLKKDDLILIDEADKRIKGQGDLFLMFDRVAAIVKVDFVPGNKDVLQLRVGNGQAVTVKNIELPIVGRVVGSIVSNWPR